MNFCPKCGNKLEETGDFCKNCGQSIDRNKAVQSTPQTTSTEQKNTMSKKKKQLFIAAAGVLACIVVTFAILNHLWSSDRQIESFRQAAVDQDYEKMAKLIQFEGTDQTIGEANAEALAGAIDEEGLLDMLLAGLTEQANMKYTMSDYLVNMETNNCFVFLSCSQITTAPIYMDVYSNLSQVELHHGDDAVITIDTEDEYEPIEAGPYTYGNHSFRTLFNNEWYQLDEEHTFFIYNEEDYLDLAFDYDFIYTGDAMMFDEITVLINDQEMDESMWQTEGRIGPIDFSQGHTIELTATMPWGEITTGKQEINDYNISYDYQLPDGLVDNVGTALQSHYDHLLEAYQTNDTAELDYLDDEYREALAAAIDEVYYSLEYDAFPDDYYIADIHAYEISAQGTLYKLWEDTEPVLTVQVKEESDFLWDSNSSFYHHPEAYYTVDLEYEDEQWVVRSAFPLDEIGGYEFKSFDYNGEQVAIK